MLGVLDRLSSSNRQGEWHGLLLTHAACAADRSADASGPPPIASPPTRSPTPYLQHSQPTRRQATIQGAGGPTIYVAASGVGTCRAPPRPAGDATTVTCRCCGSGECGLVFRPKPVASRNAILGGALPTILRLRPAWPIRAAGRNQAATRGANLLSNVSQGVACKWAAVSSYVNAVSLRKCTSLLWFLLESRMKRSKK
jgi:hypothetical protein